jgi:large subunit ribosomal protein L4e
MSNIYDLKGETKGKIELPIQFHEEFRPDLIRRAVLSLQTHRIQPHGTKLGAGDIFADFLSKRRHRFRTTYGYNQSRTPTKVMQRKGGRLTRRGANVPQAMGGRKSHPPRVETVLAEKINDKERKKAIRSALYATTVKEFVEERGHNVSSVKELPLIVVDNIEKLSKAAEVEKLLLALGLGAELDRTKEKKVRPGKGKMRGRKYRRKTGPLIIVSKKCELLNCGNVAGIDVVQLKNINAELLAPGTHPGRLTVWSESAIKEMKDKKLFM